MNITEIEKIISLSTYEDWIHHTETTDTVYKNDVNLRIEINYTNEIFNEEWTNKRT